MKANRIFGAWEQMISPIRNLTAVPYLVCVILWDVWRIIETKDTSYLAQSVGAASFLAAGFACHVWKKRGRLKLLAFVKNFPAIHPQEFNDNFLCSSGAVRLVLPERPFSFIDPANIDFRHRRGASGLLALIIGILNTIWITRLLDLAGRYRDKEFMREVAGALSQIWGARICQLARAALVVEGIENLPQQTKGPEIYLFTHKSFVDFAIAPLVIALRFLRAEITPAGLPIFLLAKDHFRDNPLLYRFLGLGRAAQLLGMIFVDRKARDKIKEARRIADEASARLLEGGNVLAIFPQGRRAAKFTGPNGERMDAGYYTVGPAGRLRTEGGHLKKGAAHIAADVAIKLLESGVSDDVKLVPVGILGSATVCPRGSMRVRPNVPINLSVGEAITIRPLDTACISSPDEYTGFVNHIHSQIDAALKREASVHSWLEQRFFEDIRTIFEPMKIEEVQLAMKPWRNDDYIVYATLDAIYARNPKHRRQFLNELVYLLLNFRTRDQVMTFRSKVVAYVK